MKPEEIIDYILKSDDFFAYMYQHAEEMNITEDDFLKKYGNTPETAESIKQKYRKMKKRYERIINSSL